MYITGIDPTSVQTSSEGPAFKLGTIGARVQQNTIYTAPMSETGSTAGSDVPPKLYKYVKYNQGAGAVAAVAGNFAYFYAPSGASAGATTEVTSDLSDSAGVGAGVLQAVIPTGGYGWVQVTGPATLTTALTAGADGNALTPVGSTDGTLDVSALVTDHICAVAIDASAKVVMLTCPL